MPEEINDAPAATVLEIQRMSTEDGPGIRTTVFFKGCALRCGWCHNPESIAAGPQLQWLETRCIGCRTCLSVCEQQALSEGTDGIVIDRERCRGCGACADACPSTALELLGTRWSVAALVEEVLKDRTYFDTSGGGVTASGGEAALQADFVAAFFQSCARQGVHTALDTSGIAPPSAYEKILPHTDLLLYDIKLMDPAAHRRHTGVNNAGILENLNRILQWQDARGRPGAIWIRTPVIPGATDHDDNIIGIGRYLNTHLANRVDRWELCAFNHLCRDKYERLGLRWEYADADLVADVRMERLCDLARSVLDKPQIVQWSGLTRREPEKEAASMHVVK